MKHIERWRALVSKGYFPKELPLAFTTDSFGRNISGIVSQWRSEKVFNLSKGGKVRGTKAQKKNSYNYSIDETDVEIISKPKRGYERRNIHITHPIPQALLSYELANNWPSVQKWLARGSYSSDRIEISSQFERSIRGVNFYAHRIKKSYIDSASDWLVKTDIARFYPTIYTHSIAWAAYDKERVKSELKLYQGSLADRLDLLVRSCNRNQTIGIPIGPETSRIIAEMISSRIDADFRELQRTLEPEFVDRLQDDWIVGVNTLDQAETVLSDIAKVYRAYGLEINGSKTSIERSLGSTRSHWSAEIGAFLSHKSGLITGARLRELLSLTLRLQVENMTESVVSYALTILESQHIPSRDTAVIESFLMKAAVVSPVSINSICRILINIQHNTKNVSLKRIGDRFHFLLDKNLEQGHLYEVMWIMYALRGLKIHFKSKKAISFLEANTSSALALILLDMRSKSLCNLRLPLTEWATKISPERVVSDPLWLLGYEGIRHGWIDDLNGTMASPFFKATSVRNVSFYDEGRNVAQSRKIIQTKRVNRMQDKADIGDLLIKLRGFNFVEYV